MPNHGPPSGCLPYPSPVRRRPAPKQAVPGVNWAPPGDNFTTGLLVLDGLNQSDSYATVRVKATGADRLRHGWGDGDGAEIAQYGCNGGQNQQFLRNSA